VNKFHGIGLVVLLAVTFVMIESAYGSTTFTNDIGLGSQGRGVTEVDWSTIDGVQSRWGESFFDNSTDTMHVIWWDDTTPDDLVFYSNTTDGITTGSPITIYTGGGGGFPSVLTVEVFSSGNDVFVSWITEEDASFCSGSNCFSLFLRYSADGGATFSAYGSQAVVFANATGIDSNDMEMVGNSLDDVVIAYRNSTSDTFEAQVSHDNGISWAFETIGGLNHGSGNDHSFNNIGDHSLTMVGNTINIAYTGNYTAGACSAGCNSVLFQQSTDAGDTWKTNPILLNSEVNTSDDEPFLLTSGSTINIIYHDEFGTSNVEQARSTNGGTSFATEINTGLQTGGCGTFQPFDEWIALGASGNLAILCEDDTNGVDFISSSNDGLSWSGLDTITTNSVKPEFFQGYTNGTHAVIHWGVDPDVSSAFSDGTGMSTWYDHRDVMADGQSIFAEPNSASGITDDRVIHTYGGNFDDEVFSKSYEYPLCLTDPTGFNCPFDLSTNAVTVSQPTNVAGVATTTGYHTIWQMNTSGDPHIYYASSPDAESGTTPLDISGIMLDVNVGAKQSDLHIFEDGTGTIDAFWIEQFTQVAPPFAELNEAFHARSTNGGTSFGTKVAIATGTLNIEVIAPVVDGADLAVAYVNGTLPNTVPFFVQSSNGGTSWGTPVDIEGGADECDRAQPTLDAIKLTKSASGNFYSAWKGDNQTSSTLGVCFNLSTDGGTTWSSTVQNLEDTIADTSSIQPFEVFSSGTDVTVIWANQNEDEMKQSRSTDSGTSFGVEEDVLDTLVTDNTCTDPSTLSEVIQDGTSIYVFCQGGIGTQFKSSTNMGSTYSSLSVVGTQTNDWDVIALGARIVVVGDDRSSPTSSQTGNIVFETIDTGSTWNETTEIFQNFILHDVITGNETNIYVGFAGTTGFDSASNNYVSMGIFTPLVVPDITPPIITISGDNPAQVLIGTTYTDAGAICIDAVDGSLTVTTDLSNVNTSVLGSFTVDYTCQDLSTNSAQAVRTVLVVEQITTTITTGGGAGAPVSGEVDTGIEGLTPEQILAFDQAVADAIASIEPSEGNIIETIIQTFFEFVVIDKVHEELQLQSFLDDERLGFRWSTGDDLVVVSATPALSPFMFTFEQFPVVRQGSGAFVSTSFILYNLEIPRTECTVTISVNCVEKIRYEIPVTVNAIINGTQVSDTGTITVDLTEDEIDPILLIILSTMAIPIIAVIIQRSRGRSTVEPLRRVIS